MSTAAAIDGADPRWLATLPRRVTPQAHEWLPGFLLRCDAANAWPAGTTVRLICPPRSGRWRLERLEHFVTARALDLEALARLVALPVGYLIATTFRPALDRLFGVPADLARAHAGWELAATVWFHVCPCCIAEDRLLARWLALPLLASCPRHAVVLQHGCSCGAHFQLFRHTAQPFTCAGCGRSWATVTAPRVSSRQWTADRRLLQLYTLFLEEGSEALGAHARRLLRAEMAARGWPFLPHGWIREVRLPDDPAAARSLAQLVVSLRELDLSAAQLQASASAAHDPVRCHNRHCPLFDVPGAGNIRRAGRRHGLQASWCALCGARFLGARVVGAFEDAPSADHTHPRQIAGTRAQGRRDAWRYRLEEVCLRRLLDGTPISLESTFYETGIPRTPHLRAHQVGLVATVWHYRILQQVLQGTPRALPRSPSQSASRPCRLPGQAYPSDLSPQLWAHLRAQVAREGQRARLGDTDRETLNALLFILRCHCTWRMLPADLPPYRAVAAQLNAWCRAGVWPDIHAVLDRLIWVPDIVRDAQWQSHERETRRQVLDRVATAPLHAPR